jgi:hypothetical protein
MISIFSILYYFVDNFAEIPEKSGFFAGFSGKIREKDGEMKMIKKLIFLKSQQTAARWRCCIVL